MALDRGEGDTRAKMNPSDWMDHPIRREPEKKAAENGREKERDQVETQSVRANHSEPTEEDRRESRSFDF